MTFNVAQANENAQKWRQRMKRRGLDVRYQPLPVRDQHREYTGNSVARIKMIVSPWLRDENGIPTRTVMGA